MEKPIVKLCNNEPLVGTFDLANGMGQTHRYLKKLVEKYKGDFEEFGPVRKAVRNSKNEWVFDTDSMLYTALNIDKKRGGQVEEFILNEEQYVLLGSYCKNNVFARNFKKRLTKEFFAMRKFIIKLTVQHQNEQWKEKREHGKISRRVETDEIKRFVEYAKSQGSKSADKYYMIFTKLSNDTLLGEKRDALVKGNVRDQIDTNDLSVIDLGDKAISVALNEHMRLGKFYKEAFPFVKDRLESMALVIGRTPLRLLEKERR